MGRTIVFNQNNIISDGGNNKLVYKFPNSITFNEAYIAVQSVSMYYSWYNISSALGNNQFSFKYPNAGVMENWVVVIPDGLYNIPALNAYFQFYCLKNGTYMTTPTGSNVFFMTFEVNVNTYSIDLCCYAIPSAINNPDDWIPSSLGFAPVIQTFRPSFYNDFALIIGWPTVAQLGVIWEGKNWIGEDNSEGIWQLTPYAYNTQTSKVSYSSYVAPQVNQNASVYLALNIINNPYALPSSIIYAITPNTGIGGLIVEKPPEFNWNKIINGTYNEITLSFLGTDGKLLQIEDPNMTILLAIKEKADAI